MYNKSITELSAALASKEISSRELTQVFLARIAQYDTKLNSFVTVTADLALEQAAAADARIAKGKAHSLTGIPIAHKDLFCTRGIKTSCGSKMLDNFIAPYNATAVERLAVHDVVLLGKTNMDEFAMGSSNENSYYGPVKNPWDMARVSGGSSGGSAAAVAARLCTAATGTDTGGSVRQPAALCGLTGIKPTYGRISRYGMIAYASSLDQAGVFTQTAADAALLLNAMAGMDEKDSTSADYPVADYSADLQQDLSGLKIGIPEEYFDKGLDEKIACLIQNAIKELEKLGATVKAVHLPNNHLSIPAYYIIAPAECSSNLSRFDGVRYGYRCENPQDLTDLYKRSRGEGFGKEVQRRIMIGTYALSAGYYDAYYLKAQKIRRIIAEDFKKAFQEVDVIIGPTSPTTAFKIGEKVDDPISMYLSDIYTIAVNLAGLPGLSIPVGFSEGLPVGMQLIGSYFNEARLLNIAHRYQQVTDWHQQVPNGFKA